MRSDDSVTWRRVADAPSGIGRGYSGFGVVGGVSIVAREVSHGSHDFRPHATAVRITRIASPTTLDVPVRWISGIDAGSQLVVILATDSGYADRPGTVWAYISSDAGRTFSESKVADAFARYAPDSIAIDGRTVLVTVSVIGSDGQNLLRALVP